MPTERRSRIRARLIVAASVSVGLLVAAAVATIAAQHHHTARKSAVTPTTSSPTGSSTATSPPATKPQGHLGRPLSCPAGSIRVSPAFVPSLTANTDYCFAAGTYQRLALAPLDGDGFYGQGKAILEGGNKTVSAFAAKASHVIIDGFTIQHYATPTTYQSPGVVDFLSGSNDTVTDNNIGPDSATGIRLGAAAICCRGRTYGSGVDDTTISHNRLHDLGYSGTAIVSSDDVTVSDNEVLHTDLFDSDTENDVAAIGKFANDDHITVVGNWVHDNNDTAIWFDVYNYAVTIRDNRVGPNNRVGIFYELSYNATISNNTIQDDGAADAGHGLGAPGAGIRVSASGYDPDLAGPPGIMVNDNTLTGNYEGIVLYNGHGPTLPVNHTQVTGNTIISTSLGPDAWVAVDAEPQQGNRFDSNTYIVRDGLFGTPGNTDWSGWQRAGLDPGGSCKTALGATC